MKTFFLAAMILVAWPRDGAFAQTNEPAHHHDSDAEHLYTCGMHPQVIKREPGNCPICGMKLVPLRRDAGSPTILIDPVTAQNMNLRVTPVARGPVSRVIRTFGKIDFAETKISDVTARYKGWIEKLDVNSTAQQVRRGDALFEINSPDLYAAQVDFLTAAWLKPAALSVTDSPKTNALVRLKFLGFSDDDIEALRESRKPQRVVTVRSPADGYVMEKMIVSGQMVDDGMKLYRLADLGTVWLLARINETDLPLVKTGQPADATVSGALERKFSGRVTHFHPMVDEKSHTAEARIEIENPDLALKPGMTATVELRVEISPDAVLVPDSAVLRSGERNTVFIALDGGKFEPREVKLGARGEGNVYQVLSGLREGERVVTSGQFLLDSESQLREAVEKMRQQK